MPPEQLGFTELSDTRLPIRFNVAHTQFRVVIRCRAAPYERTTERTGHRNGHRPRRWDTRVGTLELQVPKLRTGSSFPSWLELRKRSEQAVVAVVAEAYVKGVSTRKVEALVSSLGIAGTTTKGLCLRSLAQAQRGGHDSAGQW